MCDSIYILVCKDGGLVDSVRAFKSYCSATDAFEEYTGVKYHDYKTNTSDELIDENKLGTEIETVIIE
jgi:hypothetical protein